MSSEKIIAIVGISVCYISYVACTHGDGIIFASVIAALSGLAGYILKSKKN